MKIKNIEQHRWWLMAVFVGLGVVFGLISVRIVQSQDYADTDFFSFWLAGYSMIQGEDPYSPDWWVPAHEKFGAEWVSDETFLYPLPLAVFFIPLGLLALEQAFMAWVFISLWMILFSSLLILWRMDWQEFRKYLLPIIAGIFLFRPVILTLVHGQLGALFLLILVVMLLLFEDKHWLWGGLLLPLLALKPTFGFIITTLLIIWLVFQKRKWIALASALIAGYGLCLIGWVFNPNWMSEFLEIGSGKLGQTYGFSPTIWGISFQICAQSSGCSYLLGAILCSLCLIGYLFLIFHSANKSTPASAMGLVIPTALLITPYGWAYDQILLIVTILIVITMMVTREYPFIIPSTVFLLISLLALVLVLIAMRIEYDMWSALIPLISLMLMSWMVLSAERLTETR